MFIPRIHSESIATIVLLIAIIMLSPPAHERTVTGAHSYRSDLLTVKLKVSPLFPMILQMCDAGNQHSGAAAGRIY